MTHRELVRAQLAHIETEKLPCDVCIEFPLRDRVTAELGSDEWMRKVVNSIVQVGCFDSWCTMRCCDGNANLKIDAYGTLWQTTDDIASLLRPGLSGKTLEEYNFPKLSDFVDDAKMDAMREELRKNADKYPVCNIGAGVYELTWRLLGVEDALASMIEDPQKITRIFEKEMELLYQFVDKACELDVEALLLGDDWCDQRGVIFGRKRWLEMIRPFFKEIYALIHKRGKKAINHVCGSVAPLIPDLIDIGLDVLESVQPEAAGMDPVLLKQEYGKDISFWGGLGCQHAVTYDTPEQLHDEIVRLAENMGKGGGYILAPAKTLNITVPTENLMTILDTFKLYTL